MNAIRLLNEMKDHTDSFFGMNIASRSRKREYTKARSFFCKYLRTVHPFYTLSSIGIKLGGRDHSSVINSLSMFEKDFATDKRFRSDYELYLLHMTEYSELGLDKAPKEATSMNLAKSLKYNNNIKPFVEIARKENVSLNSVFVSCLVDYARIKGWYGTQE